MAVIIIIIITIFILAASSFISVLQTIVETTTCSTTNLSFYHLGIGDNGFHGNGTAFVLRIYLVYSLW